ncbi:MAG: TetR/AcrR family transcriptional regulator [Hyphomonadaceae bacterium]|nr:TetR/AcrR family transcriptional regulator [Hyphomonadaceae bacterium]
MAVAKRTKRKPQTLRAAPKQERAVQTRERLLDIAGALLAEVGIERISTNMIAARAGVSPAALYRYFRDKYAILEALGRRFMDRQNVALFAWLETHKPGGLEALSAHTEDLLRATADVTASEPGGVWIERALRAVPQLAHIRVESHREVTDAMLEVYAPLLPRMNRRTLWRRLRMSVELGYAIDEMLSEEDRIPRDEIFREAAALFASISLEDK